MLKAALTIPGWNLAGCPVGEHGHTANGSEQKNDESVVSSYRRTKIGERKRG
jgi:hypothetical protein